MMKKVVACWHHGDEKRLFDNLQQGRIDLYGENEYTLKGTNRLNYWWNIRMRLKKGDRIRIVVKGYVRAFATINGEPYALPANEVHNEWGSAVALSDIEILDPPFPEASCTHLRGSHRFDGPKTSLLDH